LKQKSRNQWLNLGDGNNKFFHTKVKVRNSFNMIKSLKDEEGNVVDDMKGIKNLVTDFYMKLLGETSHAFTQSKAKRVSKLIQNNFPSSCIFGTEAEITREEVRKTIFAMNQNKALGPDGFFAGFYYRAQAMVGDDVTDAGLEFLKYGRLLRETNATIITLVPKRKNPSSVGDYRPISCCNVSTSL
jgi:hypothetical protein